jgi:hypothetical protein
MPDVTFQFADKGEDPLNRVVHATMTLRDVKFLYAMLGPLNKQDVVRAVRAANGAEEADFIENSCGTMLSIYSAAEDILERAGEDFNR